ncbi:hypothetical protein FIBSPDRAFT_875081, partial [Athelia psychrophila]
MPRSTGSPSFPCVPWHFSPGGSTDGTQELSYAYKPHRIAMQLPTVIMLTPPHSRLEFGHNCASAPTLSRRTRTWASSSSRPCPSAFTSRARLGGFFIRPPHPFNTGIDMDSKETSPLIPNHSFERSVLASRLYGKVFFNWILHNEPLKEHIEAWTGVPLLVSTPRKGSPLPLDDCPRMAVEKDFHTYETPFTW